MASVSVVKLFLIAALFANVTAQEGSGQGSRTFKPIALAKSLYEQYTIGQEVDDAEILYSYQYTQSYDDKQSEIYLDFNYPFYSTDVTSATITQVKVYVEASEGATTQAYVTRGGIGENSISIQVVANESNMLHYMVVIFGKN